MEPAPTRDWTNQGGAPPHRWGRGARERRVHLGSQHQGGARQDAGGPAGDRASRWSCSPMMKCSRATGHSWPSP